MKKIKLFILLLNVVLLLTSCQNVKDGLTGSKKNNKDEFLVQKKNPLVQPPNFNELPEPKSKKADISEENSSKDIEKLLEGYNVESSNNNNNENIESIEESILEKINEN